MTAHPATALFLEQSYKDAYADYVRSLTRADFACWDYVILTASNEHVEQRTVTSHVIETYKNARYGRKEGVLPQYVV